MLNTPTTSGIPAIDKICNQLLIGDNVVWRTADLALYQDVCQAMLQSGREQNWPLVYFRFANHAPLTTATDVQLYQTQPERGFEHFITEVHRVIAATKSGGVYIFDSLSDLQEMYFSDRMIGCFFELTCPYLRRMETIAYFMLDPSAHSRHAIDPIRRTTQVWLDAFALGTHRYVQPVKTWQNPEGNTSPLYDWHGSQLKSVQESATESMVRQSQGWNRMPSSSARQIDMWDTVLMRFADLQKLEGSQPEPRIAEEQIRLRTIAERMLLSTDPRMLKLIRTFIQPEDIIAIWKRMIGTGQIGGKSVGMLLSRAILRHRQPDVHAALELHDTFFIGSDVFYTFLVENDCWWERRRLHSGTGQLQARPEVVRQVETGTFSERILQGFRNMLEYFGNAPIIVRSSSLLEDNFGNAFAGKYDSFFCANQGSFEERMTELLTAVRRIYAGTLSSDALTYRRERGVLDQDEQMALLVQRVSGRKRNTLFFPDLAGVGLSHNPYVWHPSINPAAGMSRLVLGLGTRAVDRTQNDTARICAHDQPTLQPDESRQQHLDAIDLLTGSITATPLRDPAALQLPAILVERDWRRERVARDMGLKTAARIGADQVLLDGELPSKLETIGRCLESEYGTPVEFEYTAQYYNNKNNDSASSTGNWKINIVQCRPFQITTGTGQTLPSDLLDQLPQSDQLLYAKGPIIGHGRHQRIDTVVWVDAERYSTLDDSRRYAEAKKLGEKIQSLRNSGKSVFLFGPGRWGTSTPSMGVPARFEQIRGISVLGEMDWMHSTLAPDLSLGTHFFHDLVEEDVLYIALQRDSCRIDWPRMNASRESRGCIRSFTPGNSQELWLLADPVRGECLLYTKRALRNSATQHS